MDSLLLLSVAVLLPVAAMAARAAAFCGLGLGAVLYIVWLTLWQRRPASGFTILFWMLAFAALSSVSSLWALATGMAAHRALETAPLLLAGGLLVALAPALATHTARRWLWLLPAAYALALILLAIDLNTDFVLQRILHGGDRIVGAKHLIRTQLLNRNILFLMLIYVPVNAVIFRLPGVKQSWQFAAFVIIAALAVLILTETASQTAQLVLLLGLVFAGAYPYRWQSGKYVLMGIVALLVLSAPWLAQAMFHHLTLLVAGTSNAEIAHAYMPNRMEIWDFVSRYALQKPLIGFGIDATRAVPAFDSKQLYQVGLTIPHPHNFAVQLWMEFGVVGALAGTAFLLWTLQAIFRLTPLQQRVILPVFICALAAAAMTFSLWQGWWLGTLFFAAAIARFSAALWTENETAVPAGDD